MSQSANFCLQHDDYIFRVVQGRPDNSTDRRVSSIIVERISDFIFPEDVNTIMHLLLKCFSKDRYLLTPQQQISSAGEKTVEIFVSVTEDERKKRFGNGGWGPVSAQEICNKLKQCFK